MDILISIISHSGIDDTANEVMHWIDFKGHKSRRISGEEIENEYLFAELKNEKINSSFKVDIQGELIDSDNLGGSVWFRRWSDYKGSIPNYCSSNESLDLEDAINLSHLTHSHINEENKTFRGWFIDKFSNKSTPLCKNSFQRVNKIKVLELSRDVGISIPHTIITNSKNSVCKLLKEKKRLICKPLSEGIGYLSKDDEAYAMYTVEILESDLSKFPEKFQTSLFQELLDKSIELRIFYLNSEFYPMAIFSQENKKTEIDFRCYDLKNPNRNIPFSLPEEIEKKLEKLMCKMELNTASIDMIHTKKGEYIMLEVNPIGQFAMVSEPCNYYLEEKVADHLINSGKG